MIEYKGAKFYPYEDKGELVPFNSTKFFEFLGLQELNVPDDYTRFLHEVNGCRMLWGHLKGFTTQCNSYQSSISFLRPSHPENKWESVEGIYYEMKNDIPSCYMSIGCDTNDSEILMGVKPNVLGRIVILTADFGGCAPSTLDEKFIADPNVLVAKRSFAGLFE